MTVVLRIQYAFDIHYIVAVSSGGGVTSFSEHFQYLTLLSFSFLFDSNM